MSQTIGQVELDVMDAIQLAETNLAQVHFLYCVFSIIKCLTDHTMNIQIWLFHITTPIEDTIMVGQVVFSLLHPESEDMMLIHSQLETNFVRIIGERTLSSQSSRMGISSTGWTPDQLKLGDFGIGNSLNVEDGPSGDISTLTTMVESGLGLIVNPDQTVEQSEDFHHPKPCMTWRMICRIYLFN